MMKIYLNGKFVPPKEAKVSVFDHGLLYGDGAFEGIRSYNSLVFKLEEHIDRLYETMHTIMLKIPLTKKQMIKAIIDIAPDIILIKMLVPMISPDFSGSSISFFITTPSKPKLQIALNSVIKDAT